MKRTSEHLASSIEGFNKKSKVYGLQTVNTSTPRKVLHIRGLSEDMEATNIVQYAIPFGKITNLMFAKKTRQALLEMEELNAAIEMVNHYCKKPPMHNGKTIYIQYSKYDELDRDLSKQHVDVIKAVNAGNSVCNSPIKPSPVLRVFIENKIYPVTLNALKQIFSAHGDVLKIVTFTKNSIWQALVEMENSVSAMTAKNHLTGKNVYDGCCTLKIEFSHLDSLKIRYNNDKTFDFTNPDLPQGPRDTTESSSGFSGELKNLCSREFENQSGTNLLEANLLSGAIMQKLQMLPNLNVAQLVGLRDVINTNVVNKINDQNFSCSNSGNFAFQNINAFKRRNFEDDGVKLLPQERSDSGRIVLASNMDEKKITPEDIFILFGVYGNVVKVKILYNNKDSALVEFEEDYQARDAIQNLKGISWNGKTLNVVSSKYCSIKMPNKGCEEPWLTKDFTGSKLHRFRQLNSKNHRHIFPPSSTLHLSNIPESASEETLIELFREYGKVLSFKFSNADTKIAWIKLDSVESAVQALIKLHDYKLSDNNNLRVSFTGHNL